ncbi:MAG: glutamine-hydrolyzing carbamoyl-phosphate synthase small subunit [Flavobacteriaceae bacterium]|jgi:carbamoyl-phosphate synthase small subunit|nr:glutamine-hydrolyzing carbamoyl-phosphate synthase small subunit [Flavobacteriaceae bacterium]MBT4245994.1 glutamine-hydrolyzing carbamoyl-phosphate synthase small subunit [Flavobacteriaceae bacterium]MBT5395833.1 glutamine-hydrolyzing carbamoyl-phosphate synthase small subunit [Flavobacteriaceae bacterium]MBT6688377.1 glutamine-hydrolyzing carbamoyl-phosphate synthase small subunit [Flavobacteriaceae bacterium]|tara:strand:+ start:179 stop:1294 length:1116 start_codon:yes stop_codon:yes gene_type:complete
MNEYSSRNKALILLQDGTIFFGKSLGVKGNAYGELCFNTGMTGYQEIFTDPSYFGQLIVTTNAHIGNYGVNAEEVESDSPKISGLICKNFNNLFSRPAADDSLQNFFVKYDVVAISDVDTRALVSYIRDNGAMNAVISTDVNSIDELKKNLQTVPPMVGMELASKVSTKESYFYGHPNSKIKIAALDLGVKKNILRNLSERDTYIKVFPYNSSFKEMSEWNPDGYFISNGPGDPEPLKDAIKLAKNILKTKSPLFGICLGHQVIALANGISTYKMHNGHRGINHPIINLSTGKGEVTSQNHGFAINREETELNDNVEITHVHLNDNTIAGIKIKDNNCFSVQYHPEASPGPHDSSYLFDEFVKLIKSNKKI